MQLVEYGSNMRTAGLSSTRDISDWLRAELSASQPDTKHMIRALMTEVHRWFHNNLENSEIQELCEPPADTGDRRWDALLEGVVARQLHANRLSAPQWTRRTRLDVGWDPYDGLIRDGGWFKLSILQTPVELLDKGVILPRSEFELV